MFNMAGELLLFGFCICFMSVTWAVPGASCVRKSDCGCDECCTENIQIASRKRFVVLPIGTKTCQPYLNEGERCSSFNSGCGCRPGLTCVQNSLITSRDETAAKISADKGIFYTCSRRFIPG
ncbi:uncharacterized protein LOC131927874 [Physella acuta]|uniref:uncharacterized protein LOC131927874 n=1 Tax=Physella acuta TaxID=109671 RepID=UPI0027DB52ED|nr:uncharacterized protein LOC131927874 [Physella acuta]